MNDPLKAAARVGDIDLLYKLIQVEPYILEDIDLIPFVDTPLHIAASAGHTSFATEIMRLKPSFAWKLNQYGLSPMHIALHNKHYRMVSRFVHINKDLVRVKGREGLTPLHIATIMGKTDLMVKFLSACPDSIEDVTVKSETALHIALKYNQIQAFEALLGWLQRTCHKHAQKQEKRVLNWQDEEGNTVLHDSAVRLLVDSNIDLNAKNVEDMTALDIVEKQPPQPYSVEIRDMLVKGGALRGFSLGAEPLREEELRSKITFNEKVAIWVTRLKRRISNDTRNALLVVAILFATSTYEAALNPPGGVYQAETKPNRGGVGDAFQENSGKAVMKLQTFCLFWSFNTCSFYLSILMICLLMPRGRISVIVTSPLALFSGCYVFSMYVISPSIKFTIATVALPNLLIALYFWGTIVYIRLAKKLRMYGRELKDMSRFSAGNRW
ncbi:PGG domain [Sesbania bispinosa]|nr:PGG domain [Sesbania bispinosa]